MLKKVVLCGLALLALAGASVAYSALSPSAKLQKQDRLYGGGQFGPGYFSDTATYFANPRNFAVDAHAQGDGSEAVGNSDYAAPGGSLEEYRSVTCLRVEGNKAAIGGVIESGGGAFWYAQYFVDRGGPAAVSGSRDLASPSFVDPANSPNWPAGFPYTCPSPATGFPGGAPIFRDVDEGDVVVQDAPSD